MHKLIVGENDLASRYPAIAAEWNYERNAPLVPSDVTYGSKRYVWWKCEKGHEWRATICDRKKAGCPICGKRRVLAGLNDLATVRPDLLSEWDYQKNEGLAPQSISSRSSMEVWWVCKEGHHWKTSPDKRYSSGCPICSGHRILVGYNDLATTNPELIVQWDWEKNGDLRPENVMRGTNKKVWWKCEKGHEWQASPNTRTNNKTSCPFCSGLKVIPGETDLSTINPELAAQWHPTKNGCLSPSDVSSNSHKKVWWIGDCGHEWQASPNNRMKGHGCPECVRRNKTSFPEQAILFYLKQVFPDAQNRYKECFIDSRTELDIFIPSSHIGIEYDGIVWHSTAYSRIREKRKYQLCLQLGIYLIRVKESESLNNVQKEKDCDFLLLIPFSPKENDIRIIVEQIINHIDPAQKVPTVDFNRDRNSIRSAFLSTLKGNSLESVFPDIAEEWNNRMNGSLLPSMFASNSNEIVWWKCKKGHEWQASINNRVKGHGCPYCSGRNAIEGETDLASRFPALVAEWHPEKNGDLLPSMISYGSGKNVWWKCEKGHEWQASPNSRINGQGCPFCSNRRILVGFNDLSTTNPELIVQWDWEKNGDLRPENVMRGTNKKVWWKCEKGHEWQASVGSRVKGHGCPYCSGRKVIEGETDLASQ